MAAMKQAEQGAGARNGPKARPNYVIRFSLNERLQHLVMIITFMTLVFTGIPLKFKTSWWAPQVIALFGGVESAGVIHRIAAAGMLALAVYHLGYLAYQVIVLRTPILKLPVMPTREDFRHFRENILYFLGRRTERPAFGKFTYYEKFDYWAVFWGIAIMGGSGLILWFPEWATRYLPGVVVNMALIIHSDEALLAILAIFIWHFYNVHWNPEVFPMSWTMFTGRISLARLRNEHYGEYRELVEKLGIPSEEEAHGKH